MDIFEVCTEAIFEILTLHGGAAIAANLRQPGNARLQCMAHPILLVDLPEQLAQRARQVATSSQRRLEDVLLDWLAQSAVDSPVELLADDQVLALTQSQLSANQQTELSMLLEANREGRTNAQQQARLEELMVVYRRGLVRKAQSVKVAVERGLIPPLN